jgi:mRNA interferase MazF
VKFKRGDIVWVKFPFSDGFSNNLRPALIISNNIVNITGDYLLMQVTTRLRNDELSCSILNNSFKERPLLKQSELRLHKIFILQENLVSGKVSSLNEIFMNEVLLKLAKLIS